MPTFAGFLNKRALKISASRCACSSRPTAWSGSTQTAISPDNLAAQAVYDHLGATRETWIDYWLDTGLAPSEDTPTMQE